MKRLFPSKRTPPGPPDEKAPETPGLEPLLPPMATSKPARRKGHLLRNLFLLLLLAVAGWFGWLYRQIQATAHIDGAQPADAIAVFGAAEYLGHPSPVLHARLDKTLSLYRKGLAPIIITLGGGGDKDSGNTEGAAARDYLLANGVPFDHIIAETNSFDTEQQVQRLADIANQHNFRTLDVVSDGTHLYRIALLCRRAGLTVYTSPRNEMGRIDDLGRAERVWHEMLSYTFLRLDLRVSWLHLWMTGH